MHIFLSSVKATYRDIVVVFPLQRSSICLWTTKLMHMWIYESDLHMSYFHKNGKQWEAHKNIYVRKNFIVLCTTKNLNYNDLLYSNSIKRMFLFINYNGTRFAQLMNGWTKKASGTWCSNRDKYLKLDAFCRTRSPTEPNFISYLTVRVSELSLSPWTGSSKIRPNFLY